MNSEPHQKHHDNNHGLGGGFPTRINSDSHQKHHDMLVHLEMQHQHEMQDQLHRVAEQELARLGKAYLYSYP